MTIIAIPTVYRDVQFRSRLEARWAAFFDLCGWRWSYEPIDLSGWIPDFIIHGFQTVLVEVKPTLVFQDEVAAKAERGIAGSEWAKCDLLMLGLAPFVEAPNDCHRRLGWLGERYVRYEEPFDGILTADPTTGASTTHWFAPAPLGFRPGGVGFCHSIQGYHCRITGQHCGGNWGNGNASEIDRLWNLAGNAVQWKAPK